MIRIDPLGTLSMFLNEQVSFAFPLANLAHEIASLALFLMSLSLLPAQNDAIATMTSGKSIALL